MEESPSLLRIGKRCADYGFGFLWTPGEEPILFDDQKTVIRLRVKDHIPYLETNDETEHEPMGKLTVSGLKALDYPEEHAEEPSGDGATAPGETPIAARLKRLEGKIRVMATRGTKEEAVMKMKLRLALMLEGV